MNEKKPTLRSLTQKAVIGAIFVAGTKYLLTELYQWRLRRTLIFKRVDEVLRSNQDVMEHLGEPIRHGHITFSNLEEESIRKFSCPVTGSITKGKLNGVYLIDKKLETIMSKLEIQVSDKLFTLYENKELKQ